MVISFVFLREILSEPVPKAESMRGGGAVNRRGELDCFDSSRLTWQTFLIMGK